MQGQVAGHGQGQCKGEVEGHGQEQCRGKFEGHGQGQYRGKFERHGQGQCWVRQAKAVDIDIGIPIRTLNFVVFHGEAIRSSREALFQWEHSLP